MQQYIYKNSGIEWLEKVPEHWGIHRLFGICNFVRGNSTFEKNDLLSNGKYVALQYGKTYKVEEVNEEFEFYVNKEFYKSSQTVDFGDVIFVSTSETTEDLGHSVFYNRKDIGLLGGEQILLKPNKNILDGKYLFYTSKVIGKQLNKFATGIKVFRFDIYDLKTFYIPLPPVPEQKAIADYLDKACARIDRIIAIKEEQLRKIEGYYISVRHKLITQGINNSDFVSFDDDFLKKVPKHWKKQKLRYLLELKNGKLITNDELVDDGEIPVYGGNGIMGRTDKYNYDGELLILGRVGAKCGNVHYTNQKIWVSDNAISVRSIINYQFMYQLLTVIDLHRLASETAQPLLVGNNVKKLYVAIPPINEQSEIVEMIETAFIKTQNLKKKVTAQISTLQSYRKSLIHECVTGKKQVYTGELKSKKEVHV